MAAPPVKEITKPKLTTLTEAEIAAIFKKATAIANEDLTELKHPLKPMLWKVEGKEIKKASYLFGSIHVADENITTLHPDAEAAYQQANTIATEVSMGLLSQLASINMMSRQDGKTLKESIGEDLHTEINAELAAIHDSLSTEPFEKMKTWAVTLMLGMMEEAVKGGEPLDLQIWDRAGDDDKKRWALETSAEQMGGFDKMTEEEQIILLKDSIFGIKLFKKEKLSPLVMLKNLYLKGELEDIYSIFQSLSRIEGTNQEVSNKFEKLILFDRNERMTTKIIKKLTEAPDKSHFMVAGTLHYIGDHNVVDLLRKQGYKVTRQ